MMGASPVTSCPTSRIRLSRSSAGSWNSDSHQSESAVSLAREEFQGLLGSKEVVPPAAKASVCSSESSCLEPVQCPSLERTSA